MMLSDVRLNYVMADWLTYLEQRRPIDRKHIVGRRVLILFNELQILQQQVKMSQADV